MPITIIVLGVILLLVLMIVFKVNGFIALVFVSAVVGIAEGMTPLNVMASIQKGIGSTLGGLAMILGFGARAISFGHRRGPTRRHHVDCRFW